MTGHVGDVAVHRNGSAVFLWRRRTGADATPLPGWWVVSPTWPGSGGLADSVLEGDDWTLLTEADLKLIALQRLASTTVDIVTLAQDVQKRVEDFTNEMRALGIHVGVNGRCATCAVDWPCPQA